MPANPRKARRVTFLLQVGLLQVGLLRAGPLRAGQSAAASASTLAEFDDLPGFGTEAGCSNFAISR